MSTPVIVLNISPEMCCEVPLPADPKLSWLGRLFASAMNSLTFFAGSVACTTSMFGCVASIVIGLKSFSAS